MASCLLRGLDLLWVWKRYSSSCLLGDRQRETSQGPCSPFPIKLHTCGKILVQTGRLPHPQEGDVLLEKSDRGHQPRMGQGVSCCTPCSSHSGSMLCSSKARLMNSSATQSVSKETSTLCYLWDDLCLPDSNNPL